MLPTIGPIKLYTLVYVLSMLAHYPAAQYWCRRMALPRRVGVWLSVLYVFGMAVGARMLYDLVQQRFDYRNYLRPGYYFEYGLWGGPLAYLVLAAQFALIHHRRRDVFDLIVLALPLPLVLAKVACLFNGCCYGLPCDWPWCVAFPVGAVTPPGIARHATQAYEILVLLIIWLVLVRLDRRRWGGLLTLWFVFLYGLGRPLTEVFRAPDAMRPSAGMITTSQLVCLAGAIAAAAALLALRPRRSPGEPSVGLVRSHS